MTPARAAPLAALAALFSLVAGIPENANSTESLDVSRRSIKSLDGVSLGAGCLYEGAWHREGSAVPTGAACLRCACRLGALACRRRACAPLPAPPPRCHVRHRKGACCPELHCPDGVTLLEQEASARLEDEGDVVAPSSISHACVEGGSVYAAGSAMRSARPCEHCFCLGGTRRCVRPRCLPPPARCSPRAAPGACCPDRYYCRDSADRPTPPQHKHVHDCKVDDKWVSEGERVVPAAGANCSQCYCLRGAVQCQPLACAPPLLGCTPLLLAGECCAHQYRCEHNTRGNHILTLSSNALTSTRNDDRAFHSSKSNKHESTTKTTLANVYTASNSPNLTATKNHLVSTTKVKRKTSDPPLEVSSLSTVQSTTVTATSTVTPTREPTTAFEFTSTMIAKLLATTETTPKQTTYISQSTTSVSTTDFTTETTSTEQPEGSIKITVNGTINCTAELSSTSLPLNMTFNDTEKISVESHPRIPLIDVANLEDHTFSANDIITDRTVNGGFDENESFVINVTSSLNANTNHSHTVKPPLYPVSTSAPAPTVETNSSKKTKGDYDYDYTEPTLPPSLPNLKIIPFVAADAVLEDKPKKPLTYPILEREDKFPVYYPSAETKDSSYATKREDVYRPTQYPVFITDKPDHDQYPSLTPDVDLTNPGYSNIHPDEDGSINKYTVSSSLGNRISDIKSATQPSLAATTFTLKTPAVNLFSPPVETEGGFVPKGPTGLIDEYFAVFPSTPPGPAAPHLTTSMQLDVVKGECVTGAGQRVAEGHSVSLACSECTCAWGELHCAPRACAAPAGCRRRPAAAAPDPCCPELVCDEDTKTTQTPDTPTEKFSFTETTKIKTSTEAFDNFDELVKEKLDESTSNSTVIIDTPSKNTENISDSFMPSLYESTKNESAKNKNVTSVLTTTERSLIKPTTTTTAVPAKPSTESYNQSLEYEEDDDEGFSFGSVLKLLLSDTYESTTTPPKRIPTTTKPPPVKFTTTSRRPRPTLPPKLTIAPFVPLPIHPYIPSKANPNSINRIDHLVLGEATAIKKTTPRVTSTFRPTTSTRPTSRPTTSRAPRPTELTVEEGYSTQDAPKPPGGLPGLGPGLLKLAGCNIYGRMYRVGRIITELSTPCQECWCTELGVQCKQLAC